MLDDPSLLHFPLRLMCVMSGMRMFLNLRQNNTNENIVIIVYTPFRIKEINDYMSFAFISFV